MASSIGNHSLIRWDNDTPAEVLAVVATRLREMNKTDGARELSLAITKIEEAQHWLRALAERRSA